MKKEKVYFGYDRILEKVVKCKTRNEAIDLAKKGAPEYVVNCPKCDCMFGAN